MAEVGLNMVSMFDRGYVVEALSNLVIGVTYNLNINDGTHNINKLYTPTQIGKVIIDSWGGIVPINGNVCVTLTDDTCSQVVCNFIIT